MPAGQDQNQHHTAVLNRLRKQKCDENMVELLKQKWDANSKRELDLPAFRDDFLGAYEVLFAEGASDAIQHAETLPLTLVMVGSPLVGSRAACSDLHVLRAVVR